MAEQGVRRDTALLFSGQMARQTDFNRTAIAELEAGTARCRKCGQLIRDWQTYYLPSEGSFPVYDCDCGQFGEHYTCQEQLDFWEARENSEKVLKRNIGLAMVSVLVLGLVLLIAAGID